MLSTSLSSLFQAKFGKSYATAAEREYRFGVFARNLREIQASNLEGKSWTEGVTQFADLTREEFVNTRLNG